MNRMPNRRQIIRTVAAGAVGLTVLPARYAALAEDNRTVKGNIKQSVCRWCYGRVPLEKLAAEAARIGYKSIELIGPEEYKVIKPFGLTCAMVRCKSITDGLNRKENHDWIEEELRTNIEFAAAEGIPNVLCMSGNRRGMSDEEGLENCVVGLKRVIGLAEQKKVTICMELLNSKVDHKDYMCDRTAWGVALVKKLGSPRFKLLYDIYHMQIMEGDIIRTIRDNKEYIGHYHTGGVPGRHEIDESQELYYPAIVKAILETGYTGFLGQEYIPTKEPAVALASGFRICDV
ncbi:MAG: TIM barrel protein [Gemmatales bacterium]|nr:TIM barrel protein [Gemmatales bacterium]MDW8386459.1 TIM barrel protein [Gemmatales bacterium]